MQNYLSFGRILKGAPAEIKVPLVCCHITDIEAAQSIVVDFYTVEGGAAIRRNKEDMVISGRTATVDFSKEDLDALEDGVLKYHVNIDSLYIDQRETGWYVKTPEAYIPSGGGSNVEWNQIVTEGRKIAEIKIDGETTEVFAPEGGEEGFPYTYLGKREDRFWDIEYGVLDYDFANEYFEGKAPVSVGGCTSVRKGNKYAKNHDWLYSNMCEFAVKTKNTFGIAGGISAMTEEWVENNKKGDFYKVIPFYLNDGFNKEGLAANVNVVLQEASKGITRASVPAIEERERVCSIMLVRFILDRFKSAQEAVEYIRDYVSVFMPQGLIDMGYESHYMIGDKAGNNYVLEFVNGSAVIASADTLTNFYLDGTYPNEDGTFYSVFDVPEHTPSTENGLTPYASGVERYNFAKTFEGNIRDLMDSLFYTHTYTDNEGEGYWYSEAVGSGLTIDTPAANFASKIAAMKAAYANRDRSNPQTWETTHSVIYDLDNLTARVEIGENIELEYEYSFNEGISKEEVEEIVENALTGYTKTNDFATINGSGITSGGNIVIPTGKKRYVLNQMTQEERSELYTLILAMWNETQDANAIMAYADFYLYRQAGMNGDRNYVPLDSFAHYRGDFFLRGMYYEVEGSAGYVREMLSIATLSAGGNLSTGFDEYAPVIVGKLDDNHKLTFDKNIYRGNFGQENPVNLLWRGHFSVIGKIVRESDNRYYVYGDFPINGVEYEGKWEYVNNASAIYWREKQQGGGGECNYQIVEALSGITAPYEGLRAYVKEKYGTFSGFHVVANPDFGSDHYAGHILINGVDGYIDLYYNGNDNTSRDWHWDWENDAGWHDREWNGHHFMYRAADDCFEFYSPTEEMSYEICYEDTTPASSVEAKDFTALAAIAAEYTYTGTEWVESHKVIEESGVYPGLREKIKNNPYLIFDYVFHTNGRYYKALAQFRDGSNYFSAWANEREIHILEMGENGNVWRNWENTLDYVDHNVKEQVVGTKGGDYYLYRYRPEDGYGQTWEEGKYLVGDLPNDFKLRIEILRDGAVDAGCRARAEVYDEMGTQIASWDNWEWTGEWDWQDRGEEYRFVLKLGYVGESPYDYTWRTILCSIPLYIEPETNLENCINQGYMTFQDHGYTHIDTVPSVLLNKTTNREIVQLSPADVEYTASSIANGVGESILNQTIPNDYVQHIKVMSEAEYEYEEIDYGTLYFLYEN